MDELSRLPGIFLVPAIEVSGDEILHVFDVRFQNVAGDIETENVDDSFVRCDDFTNFFIDETILELFSSRGVPLKQKSLKKTHSSSEVLFQADPFFLMVSSKLTVNDFFFSFSSDCKKEKFPDLNFLFHLRFEIP